ncbi:MAG: HAMP domain-containing histidine kinase [Thermoplasmata archaeon]|nr:HAMP domain-containing histidine kinase [Thermoplasmata archaeon]
MDDGVTIYGNDSRSGKNIAPYGISDDLARRILEITLAVLHHGDEVDILEVIGSAAVELFPIERLVIYRVNDNTGEWEVRLVLGYPDAQAAEMCKVSYTRENWKDTLKISEKIGPLTHFVPGEHVVIDDYDTAFYLDVPGSLSPRKSPEDWHPMDFIDTILFDKNGHELGCIEILATTDQKKLPNEAVPQLEILASIASIAIEMSNVWNAQDVMLQTSGMRARVFARMLNLATNVVSMMDRPNILAAARDFLSCQLDFRRCRAAVLDEWGEIFRFLPDGGSDTAGTLSMKTVASDCDPSFRFTDEVFWIPVGQLAEQRIEQMPFSRMDAKKVRSLQRDPDGSLDRERRRHDLFVIPFRDRHGETVAVIYFTDREDDGTYEKDLLELVGVFGSIVSLAFRNNVLIDEIMAGRNDVEMLNNLLFHDISNYNTGIGFYLDLLADPGTSQERKSEALAKARKHLELSNELIARVKTLVYVRVKGSEGLGTVDLFAILSDLVKEFEESSSIKTLRATVSSHQDSCPVHGNALIHDLFRNILNNSLKYDMHEEVKVDISIERCSEEGRDWWVTSIADHGVGIPDDKKAAIFERFAPRVSGGQGMGLGLSIVKSVAEQLGGRISVEDRVNGDHEKGSVFKVMLPVSSE